MTPRDSEALERIVECIEMIDGYVARGGEAWSDDNMVVDAVPSESRRSARWRSASIS
jgi:hypothetical protein